MMSHCALCVLSATITISFTSVIILQSFGDLLTTAQSRLNLQCCGIYCLRMALLRQCRGWELNKSQKIKVNKMIFLGVSHLSPGVSLIYDLVHDIGILQSELFTSRSQDLFSPKLPN